MLGLDVYTKEAIRIKEYRLFSKESYDGKIGDLLSMLDFARAATLKEVATLTQDDLDYLSHSHGNTVGALLLHIASIEYAHQIITFKDRDLSESENSKWQVPLELGESGRDIIKNQPLDYYTNQLMAVRNDTLDLFSTIKEDWLYIEGTWPNGVPINYYYLWFHVMEDEMNHCGQIKAIKRLLSYR